MKRFFIKRYKELGWNYKEIKPKQALRINTLRIKERDILQRLKKKNIVLKKSKFGKYSHTIHKSRFSLGSTLEYLLGYYYLQDPIAQHVVEVLEPKQGEKILDLCAAPGGKTTYISQLMNNKGQIFSIDNNKKRCQSLQNNLERCHCSNVSVFSIDVLKFPTQEFDKVLLDAPCSGNFTLEKDWFKKRNIDDIKNRAKIQRKLLEKAFDCTKKKGTIIYSTCSLEKEENEENIEWFQDNFQVKKILQQRFWPSEENTGFFIAKFVKK